LRPDPAGYVPDYYRKGRASTCGTAATPAYTYERPQTKKGRPAI